MESIVASVEDKLITPLDFKLKPGASYVKDREACQFFASGSNIYTPENGTRVIKFALSNSGWLDPSTVRVMYTLNNLKSPRVL